MKVRYIEGSMFKGHHLGEMRISHLSVEKDYFVLSVEKEWYRIVDDSGEDYLYPP